MKRREFLGVLGGATASAVGGPAAGPAVAAGAPLVERLVAATDRRLPPLLARQEREPGHRWLGGFRDDYGIHNAPATAGAIKRMVAAWISPASTYHRSSDLARRLELASRYLLAAQHPDGTIDLHTTNFHSPPDTGFVVEPLAIALAVLRARSVALPGDTVANLTRFIRAAGPALASGGIHTPNHRWVVCAALARVHALEPDPAFVARVDEWLAEGIDIDPDGQYSERSTAIYSPLTDRMLITVGRLLNRPALLDPVRRNLTMTLYYVHPDGEVATDASRRQDQSRPGALRAYHLPYRHMAITDGNGQFAAMARLIEDRAGDDLADDLLDILEDPVLQRGLPGSARLPDDYARHFTHSDLVRIRRGDSSATIVAGHAGFLSFRRGSAVLEAVRLAAAFFGKGQFVGDRIEVIDGGYRLHQRLEGPYFQPLPPSLGRADGQWDASDRARRRQSEVQQLESTVTVTESGGRLVLDFTVSGTERVPVAIELGFRRGGRLGGVTPIAGVADAYFLGDESGRYTFGDHTIAFGPGARAHDWTQLRGAAPRLDALSVYLTGFTPIDTRLTIG